MLVAMAESMEISSDYVYQAVNSGCEDVDAISSFAEKAKAKEEEAKAAGNQEKVKQKLLWTTKNREDFDFVTHDKSSTISASVNSHGHLRISAMKEIDKPKSVSLKAEEILEKCDSLP